MKTLTLTLLSLAAAGTAWFAWPSTEAAASPSTEVVVEPLSLTFGIYRTDKATTMYRKFLPLVEEIQDELGTRLDRPVDIELKIYKTYDEGLDSLVEGTADFVRFGPASYVLAHDRQPAIELLAMEHKKGKKRFNGVICVRQKDRARTLADLRGRSFAFGDENSTIGRYLSQAELVRAGVHAADLERFEFLGRHDAVAKAVELGDFDAGALKSSTFEKMNKSKKLRVLHTFENVTKPWVARAKLEPEIAAAIRSVLLELDDEEALAALKISGWLPTSDEEYAFVREGMKVAEEQFEQRQKER